LLLISKIIKNSNTLCDQNAETFNVKAGGTFSNQGYLRPSGILPSASWYRSTQGNIPEKRKSHLHGGGSSEIPQSNQSF
jgi:hypothetical protein